MALAGILSAVAPFLLSAFGGSKGAKKDTFGKVSNMSPEQSQFLKQFISQLGPNGGLGGGNEESINYLREMLNPSEQSFDKFADPFRQQFEQQTIPGLAERFGGMGGGLGGGLSSSGFGQSLSAAGGNLQTQLAALKAGLAGQAGQQLMGQYGQQSGMAMGQSPFTNTYQPGRQNAMGSFASSYAGGGMPGFGELLKYLGVG